MTHQRLEEIAPANGVEFKPAVGKLWTMLIVFALMIPGGALAAYFWWRQVELPGGAVLSAKAGVVGLLVVPIAIFLVLVMAALIASAKRLIIGESCVQMLSKGRVAVHIPFQNVADAYATGETDAGVVGLKLRDRNDPGTLVPFWTKESYEIQTMTYGKPLQHIHQLLQQRLAAFRAYVTNQSARAKDSVG